MNKVKISNKKLAKMNSFSDVFIAELSKSKKKQKLYLETAFEDYKTTQDLPHFLLAVRNIAIAKGGIIELSKKTNLNRQTIYKALSNKGNPSFVILNLILTSLDVELRIH